MKEGVLYYIWIGSDCEQRRYVVPLKEREEVIRMSHDTRIGGHWGRDKTIASISRTCYWPTLRRDVELFVATCAICNQQKNRSRNRAELQSYQAGYPGERIHLDFMGPLTTSTKGNKYVLSIIDQFTKWIEICPLPDQSAELTAHTLVDRWISRFGVPVIIHTDQGKSFDGHLFRELCQVLEIGKTRTTPYRPSSNGQVERYNQQIASFIRCFLGDKANTWDQHLELLGMSLRATVSRVTGFTPNMMVLGREVTLPMDVLFGNFATPTSPPSHVQSLLIRMTDTFSAAREKMRAVQIRGKQDHAQRAAIKAQKFQTGDLVMVVNSASRVGSSKKLQPIWKGPFIVTEPLSSVLYRVADRHRIKVQHVDRLRLYLDRTVPLWVQRQRARLQETISPDLCPEEDDDNSEAMHRLFGGQDEPSVSGVDSDPSFRLDPIDPLVGASPQTPTVPVVGANRPNPTQHDFDNTDNVLDACGVGVPVRLTRTGRRTRVPSHLRDYDVAFN
jgi:transposase InsO family protein